MSGKTKVAPQEKDNANPRDRYRPIRKIAEGGFGKIYLIEKETPPKTHLVMKKSKAGSSQEIETQFNNLSAVAAFGRGYFIQPLKMDPEKTWFVMEYLPAMRPLSEIFSRRVPISPAIKKKIAQNLLAGVKLLHVHDWVHHDLKPDNIMVDPTTGEIRLIDFGLSCRKDDCQQRSLRGTFSYMPPSFWAHLEVLPNGKIRSRRRFTFRDYREYDNWALFLILLTLSDPAYHNMFYKQALSGKKRLTHRDIWQFYRDKDQVAASFKKAKSQIQNVLGIKL